MSGHEVLASNYTLDRIGADHANQRLVGAAGDAELAPRVHGHAALSGALFQGKRDERGVMGLDPVFAHSERVIGPRGAKVIFHLRAEVSLAAAKARLAEVLGSHVEIHDHIPGARPDPMC